MTASTLSGWGALALIMVAAMAVTPFLNNAATVLVMAPLPPPLPPNWAIGPRPSCWPRPSAPAATSSPPIGHQCNTLVMIPGGYKFVDYWRLGAPLSIMVALVAVPMLMLVWLF